MSHQPRELHLGADYGLNALTRRSRRLREAIEGEPRLLVRHGKVMERALRDEHLELDQVKTAVRRHGVADLGDVETAVLETDGSISIIPRDRSAKPPTDPAAEETPGAGTG